MRMLYICYHRICEPLGEATVTPYLKVLSSLGAFIDLVSFEKKENILKSEVKKKDLSKYKINFYPVKYRHSVRFLSGLVNILSGLLKVSWLVKRSSYDVIYAKGTIAAFIAVLVKARHRNIKIVFDNDGLWAQERKDAAIFGNNPLIYKPIFLAENYIYKNVDYFIVLTQFASDYVKERLQRNVAVFVRPICAANHFFENDINNTTVKKHVPADKVPIIYTGAVGTWYMLNEMLDFFLELFKKEPNAFFIFLTYPENIKKVKKAFLDKGISENSFLVDSVKQQDMAKWYANAACGLYFIKPFISKKASSPTKLAEMLASGLYVVTNSGIGDVDKLLTENDAGIVCRSFTKEDYEKCASDILLKIKQKDVSLKCRSLAKKHLSMDVSKSVYEKLFAKIKQDMNSN